MMHKSYLLSLAFGLACAIGTFPAGAQSTPPVDANLYTTFSVGSTGTSVSWSRCGSTSSTEGCYGAGSLGPFNRVCAMMDNLEARTADSTIRAVYVLDGGVTTSDVVTLSVYTFTDTISSFDTTTVVLRKKIDLTLTGGSTVACSMAANSPNLYLGTNASTSAAVVNKATLAVSAVPGFSPPSMVTGITSDERGYVTVQYGIGFYLFGPTGEGVEDGGGSALVLNPYEGTIVP